MAAVLGRQRGDERRPPARDEAVVGVEGDEAREARVDDPQLVAGEGQVVDVDVAGDVRAPRAGSRRRAGRAGRGAARRAAGSGSRRPGSWCRSRAARRAQRHAHRAREAAEVGVEPSPSPRTSDERAALVGGDAQRDAELVEQLRERAENTLSNASSPASRSLAAVGGAGAGAVGGGPGRGGRWTASCARARMRGGSAKNSWARSATPASGSQNGSSSAALRRHFSGRGRVERVARQRERVGELEVAVDAAERAEPLDLGLRVGEELVVARHAPLLGVERSRSSRSSVVRSPTARDDLGQRRAPPGRATRDEQERPRRSVPAGQVAGR